MLDVRSFATAFALVLFLVSGPASAAGPVSTTPPTVSVTPVITCSMAKLNPPQVGKATISVTMKVNVPPNTYVNLYPGTAPTGLQVAPPRLTQMCSYQGVGTQTFTYVASPVAAITTWSCYAVVTNVPCVH